MRNARCEGFGSIPEENRDFSLGGKQANSDCLANLTQIISKTVDLI